MPGRAEEPLHAAGALREAEAVQEARTLREAAAPQAARSLHVANLILEYYPVLGGAQRQLQRLAPLLRERGVEPSVLTRRYPELGVTRPFEHVEGTPVYRLPAPGGRAAASAVYTAAALLRLRRLRPDVIHAYSLFSPLTIALTAKRLYGTPVVVKVLRGGALGDVDRIHARATAGGRIAAFRRYVDAFIVISREIDAELEGMGIEAERRVYIPNGVDTGVYRPLPAAEKAALRLRLGLPAGPLAVYAGRLSPEKGVERLLGVWDRVRRQIPQAGLLILGAGEQEAALREAARALEAADSVHFVGRVDSAAPYLQAADLFVLPSSTEGLSNSLLEAMAAGMAAAASRVGAAPELIAHGESGWLFPAQDERALCEALLALLANPELRARLGEAARRRVEGDFSLISVAERLNALYRRVAGG